MPIVAHYLYANLLTICFNKIGITLFAFTNPELTMDPEFEFKETEAERLQRLVRTTDSVSILQYVRQRAMQRWMQRGILRDEISELYQCPNDGIGYRCCDGTPLSAKCAPDYPQCSNYITPTLTPVPTPTPFEGTPSVSPYVWKGSLNTTKLGESGIVIKVVDGDTFDVEGIGRIRLADVSTPEMDSKGGKEAKEYVKGLCYHKRVYLDIDDLYVTGKYGRIVAVVYVPYNKTHYVNLNQLLLKEGYAEAKDYRNEFDPVDWIGPREYVAIKSSPVRSPLPIPGFGFLLAMGGGVVAAICLIGRKF